MDEIGSNRTAVVNGRDYTGYIATFTGNVIAPLTPDPADIHIEDIAHSLSLQCRFTGHTRYHYSVGQHSWAVSWLVPDDYRMWGLLHDATEAYLSDIARPIKSLWPEYKGMEDKIMRAVAERFGLSPEFPMPQYVADVDDLLLGNEIKHLMPAHEVYQRWGTYPDIPKSYLAEMTPRTVEKLFLERYYELGGE